MERDLDGNAASSSIRMPVAGARTPQIVFLVILSIWTTVSDVKTIFDREYYTYPESVILRDGEKFDYVVVGAGAAGSAVAARLALAGNDVLLIEAGDDPNLISKIPVASMALLGSEIDWQYKTISNNMSCLSSEGQQCLFHRGKCLGGSTSINYMMYTRGNRKEDLKEIPYSGWTFDDLMPYFLRYEGLQDLSKLPVSSYSYHNTTGTMRIGFFSNPNNPWQSRLIKSFKTLQFPENLDSNAESQIGVTKVIGYVYQGERMSTARGYLAREDVKNTLKVAKNTMCTGVIINKRKITRGVTAIQNMKSLKIYARKEVILSAGAIGTPHILMLSGIGRADHLQSIGIPVIVDLPVGDKMIDHTLPLIIVQVKSKNGISNALKLLSLTATQLMEILLTWHSVLSSNGLTDISVFANTRCYDYSQRRLLNQSTDGSDCEVPNLQIIHAYLDRYIIKLVEQLFKYTTGFNDDIIKQLSKANENSAFIIISPVLLKAYSLGTVRLASEDPLVPPAIYPNYLEDERDVDEMVRSIGILEHVVETSVFKRQNASILHLNLPGCPSYDDDRLKYWQCYVRHMTFAVYHAAGTAQLGSVVDERLRVFSVQRLRVADLSVLPRPPRSNSEAVTIAIGERLVDFLLADNK